MKKLITILALIACIIPAQAQCMKQVVDSLKKAYAPDGRTAVWQIDCEEHYRAWTLKGVVDNAVNKAVILNEAKRLGIEVVDSIAVLENSLEKPWAIVKLAIASLRTDGRHAAEMATQAIMGMPVKVLEKKGDWYRVQTPDNYISYCPGNSLQLTTERGIKAWRNAKRYIVTAYQSQMVAKPGSDETVSDLVLGNILEYKGKSGKWIKLATPDGREGYVAQADVKEFAQWAQQKPDMKLVEKTARRMMGAGYLWGGTSTKVTDCSGLAKVSYFANAIILQRDASQQALTGKRIAAEQWKQARQGDLVFFGSKSGRVTHVGIYLRNGQYIHCSGRVKINSVDPNADDYLTTPFLSISRIDGEVGTAGIVAVKDHEWYF
ncbi:MAG: NlpC/P60 family protein [Muribaculaceae bacterium]